MYTMLSGTRHQHSPLQSGCHSAMTCHQRPYSLAPSFTWEDEMTLTWEHSKNSLGLCSCREQQGRFAALFWALYRAHHDSAGVSLIEAE